MIADLAIFPVVGAMRCRLTTTAITAIIISVHGTFEIHVTNI